MSKGETIFTLCLILSVISFILSLVNALIGHWTIACYNIGFSAYAILVGEYFISREISDEEDDNPNDPRLK